MVLVVAAVVIVRTEFLNTVTVSSDSMSPTLCTGDVLLVARHSNGDSVKDGDIVTFTSPQDGVQTIKRVIGTAGQTVVVKDAELFVDGLRVDEPYRRSRQHRRDVHADLHGARRDGFRDG